MPSCSKLTEEALDTGPVCPCVWGELALDGERGGRLAVALGEAIMDLTFSARTCKCGAQGISACGVGAKNKMCMCPSGQASRL